MIELTPFIRQLRRRMAALTPGPNRFAIRTGTVPVHFRVHFVPGATGMLVSFHGRPAGRGARRRSSTPSTPI